MRVAAIDCGTNSLRLLVAETSLDDPPQLGHQERSMAVVRLGQGVDTTGRFAPEALERTFLAVDDVAERLRISRPDAVRFVATSATRDASNRDVFLDGVEARLGVRPIVVPGPEEARLSFLGAVSAVDSGSRERLLVVDLGGGSTECVLGDTSGVISAMSVDMGAVRFTERFLHSDPPTAQEIAAAEDAAQALLDQVEAEVDLSSVERVIGVAGTITTVTAHALDLHEYDPARIDGATLPLPIVEAACAEIIALPKHRLAELAYIHPGRVDVIQAGAIIWRTLLRRLEAATQGAVRSAVTSEHDILDGIALDLAAELAPYEPTVPTAETDPKKLR